MSGRQQARQQARQSIAERWKQMNDDRAKRDARVKAGATRAVAALTERDRQVRLAGEALLALTREGLTLDEVVELCGASFTRTDASRLIAAVRPSAADTGDAAAATMKHADAAGKGAAAAPGDVVVEAG